MSQLSNIFSCLHPGHFAKAFWRQKPMPSHSNKWIKWEGRVLFESAFRVLEQKISNLRGPLPWWWLSHTIFDQFSGCSLFLPEASPLFADGSEREESHYPLTTTILRFAIRLYLYHVRSMALDFVVFSNLPWNNRVHIQKRTGLGYSVAALIAGGRRFLNVDYTLECKGCRV